MKRVENCDDLFKKMFEVKKAESDMDIDSVSHCSGSVGSVASSVGNSRDEATTRTKRVNSSIKWCFTINNYTENDIDMLNKYDGSKFLIFSKEVGKSGTPHLQGYIEFKQKCRPMECFPVKNIHWEKAKGTKVHNMNYITKTNVDYYLNGHLSRSLDIITELYPWQTRVIDIIKKSADPRAIHWYHEPIGNAGKSALVKYICFHYKAIVLSNKGADMKYGIVKYKEKHNIYPDIIIIDIPRSVDLNYFSYTAVEEIKNGCFFSSKYECDMVMMNPPHMMVFSNEIPDLNKMSKDRWHIHEIGMD